MIISPHYKKSICRMVNMHEYEWNPYTYGTTFPEKQNSQDLLLYIYYQSAILEIDICEFIQTIEQDLYKLRKIYESNKRY